MRAMRGLWPFVPAGITLVLLLAPPGLDPVLRAFGIALAGVGLTAAVTGAYVRSRIEPLVTTIERIAAGEVDVPVPTRRDALGRRMAAAVTRLGSSVDIVRVDAATDLLTGAANRQGIAGALFTEVERAVRYRRELAVIFGDIDHFKAINDTYGHEAGDDVLRGVTTAIRQNVRASDLVGRYGGEEFMVVLPETTVDDAASIADKLRLAIGNLHFTMPDGAAISVTISFGVTGGTGDRLSVDRLVRESDAAMYTAKALGRDQVFVFVEPTDDSQVLRSPISPAGRAQAVTLGRLANDAAAEALAAIIRPLPHYRGQPSALIATITTALSRSLDLPAHEVDKIRVAALLHDVGKVGVPQDILDKPASLTPAEWRSVIQHPRIGQVILEQATTLRDAVPIILHHHERFAGAGYPYGLRGQEIPLGARVVAIADAYDAMIHDRPYKRKISHDAAIEELRRHAGTQFDPDFVELFCDIYAAHAPEADPAMLPLAAAMDAHRNGRTRAAG